MRHGCYDRVGANFRCTAYVTNCLCTAYVAFMWCACRGPLIHTSASCVGGMREGTTDLHFSARTPTYPTYPRLSARLLTYPHLPAIIRTYPQLSASTRNDPQLSSPTRTCPRLSSLIRNYPHQSSIFRTCHPSHPLFQHRTQQAAVHRCKTQRFTSKLS